MEMADFSGTWEMDLRASQTLGPILREVGIPRVLAAVITRLGVMQTIEQDESELRIQVATKLSTNNLRLRFDGSVTQIPGINGRSAESVSRWVDEEHLETRQALAAEPQGSRSIISEPRADAFVTVRSLRRGALVEACSVVKAGVPVPGASAERILRRVG
jgi:hypothetical protein